MWEIKINIENENEINCNDSEHRRLEKLVEPNPANSYIRS